MLDNLLRAGMAYAQGGAHQETGNWDLATSADEGWASVQTTHETHNAAIIASVLNDKKKDVTV